MPRPTTAIDDIEFGSLGTLGDYLVSCRDEGMRPRTVLDKYAFFRRLHRDLGVDMAEATEPQVRTWWRSLTRIRENSSRTRGLADATRATYAAHLHAYARWLLCEGYRDDDPTRRIKAPKRRRHTPRDLDPRVVRRITKTLEGNVRWCIELMFECGLRCEEVTHVRPDRDLGDSPKGPTLRVYGKGGNERVIGISDDLAARLREAPPGWLIRNPRTGEPLTPGWVSDLVGQTLRQGGLPGATAHKLRHTFAVHLLAATGDVVAVQEYLGHDSLTTTQTYVHSTTDAARRAVRGGLYKRRPRRGVSPAQPAA